MVVLDGGEHTVQGHQGGCTVGNKKELTELALCGGFREVADDINFAVQWMCTS